jgi:hypothetical protein
MDKRLELSIPVWAVFLFLPLQSLLIIAFAILREILYPAFKIAPLLACCFQCRYHLPDGGFKVWE